MYCRLTFEMSRASRRLDRTDRQKRRLHFGVSWLSLFSGQPLPTLCAAPSDGKAVFGGLLLVIELRKLPEHFDKVSEAHIFELRHFTHCSKVSRFARDDVAFERRYGDKHALAQNSVVPVFVTNPVGSTMTSLSQDRVVELLQPTLEA